MALAERSVNYRSSFSEGRRLPHNELWAPIELLDLHASDVWKGKDIPRGDGSPVLILPGWLGNDAYLIPVNIWLRKIGYDPRASGILNIFPELHVKNIEKKVVNIKAKTGRRVHLLAHSAGAGIARDVAHSVPDSVESLTAITGHDFFKDKESSSRPLPSRIKSTYIYTLDDGILDPETCKDHNQHAVNEEVSGATHIGSVWNQDVYRKIAEALWRASAGRIMDINRRQSSSRSAA